MVTENRRRTIKIYRQEKRDQLSVDVPKGKRDAYKMIAAEKGLSLSMLIQNSVESFAGKDVVPPTPENKLSAEDKRLLDSAGKLTPDARKQLVKFLEILTARAATISDTKGGGDDLR